MQLLRRMRSRAGLPDRGYAAPDRRLHGMVERAGWIAAGETLGDAWADPGPPVEESTGDPFAALARQLHARRADVRAFFDRAQALEAQADECGALAAVLWFAEEDDARVWHLPAQRDVLARIDIPALILTRRDWRANDGVDAEIAAFLQEAPHEAACWPSCRRARRHGGTPLARFLVSLGLSLAARSKAPRS
jgi:hypothetical protein